MITDAGALHIKRYLARFVPSMAESIAIGIGNATESPTQTKLSFEVSRSDILVTSFNFTDDRIIYKATLPEDFVGTIYEAALFSTPTDSVAGEFSSRVISSFDSAGEAWTNNGVASTFVNTSTRIGSDSLSNTAAANGTSTDILDQVSLNLSGYSGADKFVFAFNVASSFNSGVKFRFHTDATNYYEFSLGAQTAGYKIVEVAKSSATVTGTPSWADITQLRVITSATSGGSSTIDYDGIRIEDVDTINPNYIMVAREVLSVPFVKVAGRSQDIEFSLDVNIA